MIKNYLILAVRNLLKRRLYSFINIFGLATGVAVCLIILKYVDFHLSFEDSHRNAADIYRMVASTHRNGEFLGTGVLSGYSLGPRIQEEMGEIKAFIRVHPMYGGAVVSNQEVPEPPAFHEEQMLFADSTFFSAFTHLVWEGDLSQALNDPSSMVITRSAALKYFGRDTNVVGEPLAVTGGWISGTFHVNAVVDDVPANSHLRFDYVLPMSKLLTSPQYQQDDGWGWQNFVTYVQLHPGTKASAVEEKLPDFIEKHRGEELRASATIVEMNLQPIREIHLTPGMNLESAPTISMNTIYFFLIIAVFILAIAWVNYINLSTARAMERAREVGIKKAVGAFRRQLVFQFLFEAVLVNFVALVLALLIAVVLLPVLADIVGQQFAFDFGDPRLWGVLAILFAFGSLVSGAYPAFVLSSFRTTVVIKGSAEPAGQRVTLRKALVVFQFVSSLVLITGTFAVYRQIMFMRNQDKGLTMEQMLVVKGPRVVESEGLRDRLITFKNELHSVPAVEAVASSATIPGGGFNWGTQMRKDGDPVERNKSGSVTWVDADFIDTYGMTLIAGRSWNPDVASDMERLLVNEAAVTQFGLGSPEEALDKRIVLGNDTVGILGVLRNFNWNSPKVAHQPILLAPALISRGHFSVKVRTANMQEAIARIETLYDEAFPGNPFDYYFLDEYFDTQYRDDKQFGQIFGLFSILAIIIACLGLWGLASFTTTQKSREISIRKVLGATTTSIVGLLSMQFLVLVLIAAVIAFPLTWYGMDSWLDSFASRIAITWDMFVLPAVVLGFLALVTVSVQIVRGAQANPAEVLRAQ